MPMLESIMLHRPIIVVGLTKLPNRLLISFYIPLDLNYFLKNQLGYSNLLEFNFKETTLLYGNFLPLHKSSIGTSLCPVFIHKQIMYITVYDLVSTSYFNAPLF